LRQGSHQTDGSPCRNRRAGDASRGDLHDPRHKPGPAVLRQHRGPAAAWFPGPRRSARERAPGELASCIEQSHAEIRTLNVLLHSTAAERAGCRRPSAGTLKGSPKAQRHRGRPLKISFFVTPRPSARTAACRPRSRRRLFRVVAREGDCPKWCAGIGKQQCSIHLDLEGRRQSSDERVVTPWDRRCGGRGHGKGTRGIPFCRGKRGRRVRPALGRSGVAQQRSGRYGRLWRPSGKFSRAAQGMSVRASCAGRNVHAGDCPAETPVERLRRAHISTRVMDDRRRTGGTIMSAFRERTNSGWTDGLGAGGLSFIVLGAKGLLGVQGSPPPRQVFNAAPPLCPHSRPGPCATAEILTSFKGPGPKLGVAKGFRHRRFRDVKNACCERSNEICIRNIRFSLQNIPKKGPIVIPGYAEVFSPCFSTYASPPKSHKGKKFRRPLVAGGSPVDAAPRYAWSGGEGKILVLGGKVVNGHTTGHLVFSLYLQTARRKKKMARCSDFPARAPGLPGPPGLAHAPVGRRGRRNTGARSRPSVARGAHNPLGP